MRNSVIFSVALLCLASCSVKQTNQQDVYGELNYCRPSDLSAAQWRNLLRQ